MKALSIALVCAVLAGSATHCLAAGSFPAEGAPAAQQTSGTGNAPAQATAPATVRSQIEGLQAQLAARPGWTEGWWQLATLAYDADRYDLAAPALERVVAAAPQMGIAWNLLGLSEFELQRYAPARTHLERAAALANSHDDEVQRVAEYHLALLQIRDGDFEAARIGLLQHFGQAPNAQVTFALGLAALRVPLLPAEVSPSREALVSTVGAAVARGQAGLPELAALARQQPGEPTLLSAYGLALEQAGQAQQALATLREAVRVAPADRTAWAAITRLEQAAGHPRESAAAHAKATARPDGEHAFEQTVAARYAAALPATDKVADWASAMQMYAAGNFAAAQTQLAGWVNRHPEDGTAWAVLGLCEFRQQQYDSALLHLERGEALGLRGDPASMAAAHYAAGSLLLRNGEFDAAGDVLASAHNLQPQREDVTQALGLALLRRKGLPADTPPQADAPVERAGEVAVLLRESRYDEAFAAFRSLLQQYPATPFLHYAFGTALIALSEFDEAAAEMRAEIKLSPDSPLPEVRLASIALRQHRPAEALAPARRALVLDAHSAEAHYLLGRALLETGEDGAAVRELEQARALNPGSPEVHFNLARAYARAHNEAAADQERLTFARLNELSQAQKNGTGGQTYTGPKQAGGLTDAQPAQGPR